MDVPEGEKAVLPLLVNVGRCTLFSLLIFSQLLYYLIVRSGDDNATVSVQYEMLCCES